MHKVHLLLYKLCPLCKHPSHWNTELYALSLKHHRCLSTIYHKCHVCHSHYRSVKMSVCCLASLRCLVFKSCWVCVHKVMNVWSHSFTHLVILSKLCQPDHPQTTKHPLSFIVLFQLLVIMYPCPQLRTAWGYLPASLHCATIESTQLTTTQNNAKVSQWAISIYAAHKHINRSFAGRPESLTGQWPQDSLPQKIAQKLQNMHAPLNEENSQTCQIDTLCPSLSPSNKCVVFPTSYLVSRLAPPQENYTIFMRNSPISQHPT